MKLLLDTHLLLWAAGMPKLLSPALIALLLDQGNELVFSSASLWEIAIKQASGRANFIVDARVLRRELLLNQYRELPVSGEHAIALDQLPPLHKDPFDRILIAQALVEGLILLTSDNMVARYPGPIRRV